MIEPLSVPYYQAILDVSTEYEPERRYPDFTPEREARQVEYNAHGRRGDLWVRHFALWGPIQGPGFGPIGEVIIYGLAVFESLGV